jgi:NB-ARC domain/MalT-like TPR region
MDAETFTQKYQDYIRQHPKSSTKWRTIASKLGGLTDVQVAAVLGISENTVGAYLQYARQEFGVKSSRELCALFDRYRYIWDEENSGETVTTDTEKSIQFNNLPYRIEGQPIGRDGEIQQLLDRIDKHPPIWVKGLGGCGKTTLLLEVAHRCLRRAKFDAIVYISAQTETMSLNHRISLPTTQRTRKDIYRQIFQTFQCGEVMYGSMGEGSEAEIYHHLHDRLCQLLGKYRTLLIFDNLDTQNDYDIFRQVTHQLPAQTQILVGSRQIFDGSYGVKELTPLKEEDSKILVKDRMRKRKCRLSDRHIDRIAKYTRGLPLAIEIVVGLAAIPGRDTRDLDDFLRSNPLPEDLLEYCLDKAIEQLKKSPNQWAYKLLQTIALFPVFADREAVMEINTPRLNQTELDLAIGQLIDLSLMMTPERGVYQLHPIVYTYANNLLAAQPPVHNALRDRWVEWYFQKFVSNYDDRNWQDWQDYTAIDREWQNLRTVVDWCFARSLYLRCLDFWRLLKGFTLFRGYWDEREQWLEWLMQAAEIDGDNSTLALARYHQSLTLCYRDERDRKGEAMALAESALNTSSDFSDRLYLLTHISSLYVKKIDAKNLDSDSLDRARKLLAEARNCKPDLSARELFVITYYEAEIATRLENLDLALTLSQTALDLAQESEYQRYIVYTKGRIAKILIAQGKLTQAEDILVNCLDRLTEHGDKRALAFCHAYLADLKCRQGNKDGWLKWREMAIDSFHKLNMQTEAQQLAAMKFDRDESL